MEKNHLWNKASTLQIQTSPEIVGGFDVGFDKKVPEETKDMLMHFVYWVEDHFHFPVTLWVDFKYRHYLMGADKKRTGYRFYWVDHVAYPTFENEADIPVIELAVLGEKQAVLTALINAISMYFAWLTNTPMADYRPNPEETEEILQTYLQSK